MTGAEIEARLRRDVSAPDFDSIYEECQSRGWVEDLLAGQSAYEDLLDDANILANFQRKTLQRAGSYTGPRPGREPDGEEESAEQPPELEPDGYAVECARSYSAYLAVWASKRPDVQHFREAALGGQLLTAERVAGFVEEHAAHGSGLWLEYPDADGEIDHVEVRPHSPAAWLRRRSANLAESYPWRQAQAVAFILTGEPPEVPPLIGSWNRDGAISITAYPWVSKQEVSRFYGFLQRRKRGGDNSPVSECARDVLLFVSEQTSRRGERPGWGELLNAWNAQNPDRTFRDRAGLWRAYRRAHKAILAKEPPPAW